MTFTTIDHTLGETVLLHLHSLVSQCVSCLSSLLLTVLPLTPPLVFFSPLLLFLVSLRCWPLSGDRPGVRSSRCSSFLPSQTVWRDASLITRSSSTRGWGVYPERDQWEVSDNQINLLNVCVCMCVFVLQMCANLRDMCVVFAGPFPAGFSEKEVRRLFRCFGPVRTIKMLNTSVRVHISPPFHI